MITLINEFSGEAYSLADKFVLVAHMLKFGAHRAHKIDLIIKYSNDLELDIENGFKRYATANNVYDEGL